MPEERKLVTVLFADIVGSTSLGHDNDPEVVRGVMGRYFERVREIVELHGGTVEKFIGDAAMAVFGVPRVHDDDAERAVRAALAIRDAVEQLNEEVAVQLEARIGVNTGEAVAAIDGREEQMVTGDVVNVAARLQQQAEPGEVIVGQLTAQLTRGAFEYEPRPPVDARGKPLPVAAFRAVRPFSETPEQARGLPQMRARLVGRSRELGLLVDTFDRAVGDQRLQLFTIVGSAGVGKSRLVGEFLARVGSRARIVRGRCLPYGTGITYWPLLEFVQSDLGVTLQQSRGEVRTRLEERAAELIADQDFRAAVVARLAVLLGLAQAADALPDVDAERLVAELGWAVSEYVEAAAARQPLIAVVDDLQWAEPPVIEIIVRLLESVADAPAVLVCIGRPELLDRYPTFGAGQPNATTIVLEPLNDEETRTLIGRLLDIDDMPDELRSAIVRRAAGNPLFCEEFVRMLIDEGRLVREGERWRGADSASFDVRVPESIQALLAARLDTLAPAAKSVLQTASVIGEQFEAGQLSALAGRPAAAELRALTRAGFVMPDRPTGPTAYRFRHLLTRDAAYASLPKRERARLHEAFGHALEVDAGDRRREFVAILAHHAWQALELSLELRQSGPTLEARARRVFGLATEAGRLAFEQGNAPAVRSFLAAAQSAARAVGRTTPSEEAELALLDAQVEVLADNYAVARQRLQRAAELALAAERRDLAAAAYLALAEVLIFAAGEEDYATFESAIATAGRLFDELGDVGGRLEAELFALERLFAAGRLTEMLARGLEVAAAAEAAGELALAARARARLIATAIWVGRTDLAEQLADSAEALTGELGLLSSARLARFLRARLAWVSGDFEAVDRMLVPLLAEAKAAGEAQIVLSCFRLLAEARIEQNRLDEALEYLDAAVERSVAIGERWSRTELLSWKAQIYAWRRELDAAEAHLAEARATLREDDLAAQAEYESAVGHVRAAEGRYAEAEAALRRAVEIDRQTEFWYWQFDALDLAEFLVGQGRHAEAAPLVAEVEAAMAGSDIRLRQSQLERLKAQLAAAPA
ncbi:MAG: AAA family ATPase [Chloroflexota bacterium]|nr:AAA family ATPase [Chloroflexota bacterium]